MMPLFPSFWRAAKNGFGAKKISFQKERERTNREREKGKERGGKCSPPSPPHGNNLSRQRKLKSVGEARTEV